MSKSLNTVPCGGGNDPVVRMRLPKILIGQLPAVGAELVEVPAPVSVPAPVNSLPSGAGLYKVKIKGKAKGKVRIAVICGNLRKVLVVNVV